MSLSVSRSTLIRTIAVTCAATALSTAVAHADGRRGPAARAGVHVGFGLGVGQMSCDSDVDICGSTLDEAGGIDVHVGTMLNPRLSLQADLWAMFHSEDQVTISHAINTLAVQYWLLPRVWVKGGLGFAVARASYDGRLITIEDQTEAVPGFMINAGYELVVGRSFALDVQLKYGTGFYDDDSVRAHNAALVAGFNWY